MRSRVPAVFLAVAVLWGIPYALIKVALDHDAEPLLIAWARVALGAALLLGIAAARRELRGLRGHGLILLAIAVTDVAGPFVLLTFAGVVVLLGVQLSGDLAAAGMVLLAAFGYGIATLLVRRLSDVPPVAISAVSLSIAAVLLAPGAAASLPTHATGGAWAAIVALGILCTAAAYFLYYLLIAEAGATRAALTTYLAPVFSVVAGAIALSEAITAAALGGLVLILAGSWLAR